MRTFQDPVTKTTDSPVSESETTHPAFGQIGVSRIQGGKSALYGSDFVHHGYVVIRITESTLCRGLSNDRYHPDHRPFVEVALTEAQWATFVSSMNMGMVPCTIESREYERVPQIPAPPEREKQFSDEYNRRFEGAVRSLDSMAKQIELMNLPKGKSKELLNRVRGVRQEISNSAPFVAEQFEEHMESLRESAKAEIHGYMNGTMHRAGLTALGAQAPLALEHKED